MAFSDSELLEEWILQKFVTADGQVVGPLQSFYLQRTNLEHNMEQLGL
jgi:hypothetical protein